MAAQVTTTTPVHVYESPLFGTTTPVHIYDSALLAEWGKTLHCGAVPRTRHFLCTDALDARGVQEDIKDKHSEYRDVFTSVVLTTLPETTRLASMSVGERTKFNKMNADDRDAFMRVAPKCIVHVRMKNVTPVD
jgi:hypothetical protein